MRIPGLAQSLRDWRDSCESRAIEDVAKEMCFVIDSLKDILHSYRDDVVMTSFILFNILSEENSNRSWRMTIRRLVLNRALGHFVLECRMYIERSKDTTVLGYALNDYDILPEELIRDVELAEAIEAYSHNPHNNKVIAIAAARHVEKWLPSVVTGCSDAVLIKSLSYLGNMDESDVRLGLETLGWW
jgi:hypothetical protein